MNIVDTEAAAKTGGAAAPAKSPQRRLDPADVRRLAERGLTISDIAQRTGFNSSTVSKVSRRHGIRIVPAIGLHKGMPRSAFWREHDEILRRLVDAGANPAAAASAIGASRNAVIGRAHRLELVWRSSPNYECPQKPAMTFPPKGHCLMPGEAKGEWCGAPALPGRPYCPAHHRVVYRPTPPMANIATASSMGGE